MKVKNLNINIACKFIRMFLGVFFLLLTTPYITRILGKDSFGKIEYFAIIVSYITLVTNLGLPNYGVREVAKYRNDSTELNKVVVELLFIAMVMTILGYIFLIILILVMPDLKKNLFLVLILSLDILLNNLGIEWYYQGIEDQIYITKKFLLVRLICLIGLFLFIKTEKDFLIYAFIFVFLTKGSNFFNLINLKNHIKINVNILRKIEIKKHFKPIFTIFLATVAASIYSKIDIFMIGKFLNNSSVGIYVVAYRMVSLIISLIISVPTICMPRICNYLHHNENEKYIDLMQLTFKTIVFFMFPISILLFFMSEQLIYLFAGKSFIEASLTLKLMIPLIVINSISNYLGIQVLYPKNLEKKYTKTIIIICFLNMNFNYYFINKYGYNGAVIGTIIAELVGLFILFFYTKDIIKDLKILSMNELKYIISCFISVIILFLNTNIYLKIVIYLLVYVFILNILKEKLIIQIFKYLKQKANLFK